MAVDTRNKRASCLTSALPVVVGPIGANPDGAFVQADRQQMGWIYAGINVGTDLPAGGGTRRRRISFAYYGYVSPVQTNPVKHPIITFTIED
jgi:hypothetical protein